MHLWVRLILAVSLLVTLALGQEPAPQAPTSSDASHPQAAAASPASIDLRPDSTGAVPQEQIRELLRRVAERDLENDKRGHDYTYIEREETHRLDGHGQVKKVESRTTEILEIYGEEANRLIAKDDKPLSADDARKEEEKIQKIFDKRKNESEGDRRKRLEREEKSREKDRQFVKEVADAFNFRLVGSEEVGGREAWVLDGEPRPGYEPKSNESKMLSKFKGRIWIDKAEAQWVKVDITAIDTISFGVFLARIHKGTRIVVETTRVNEEVWLPKHVTVHIDVRLALLKNYDVDVDQVYRDYKKFRTESKITVVGETQ